MKNKIISYSDEIAKLFPGATARNVAPSITFQVTEDCNLRCTYCYQHNKTKNKMTFETAKKFIDNLLAGNYDNYLEFKEAPAVILEFIGGEPLLEINLIDQICDYFMDQTIKLNHRWAIFHRISMSTNGTLYFQDDVQRFIDKHRFDLSLSFSIDGNKELHDACRIFPDGSGSYDLAISAQKDFYERTKQQLGTKLTLAPENIPMLFNSVKDMFKMDYNEIHLNCVFENVWKQEDSTILYNQLKQLADYIIDNDIQIPVSMFDEKRYCPKPESDDRNWCGGTGSMIAVDWRGDIYPCLRYMPSSLGTNQPPYKIGNVDTGILSCKEECDKVECLKCITRRSQSTDECWNCPIAEGCSWCSAYNYEVFGTPNKRATFICEMHKATALANVYFWNKYYRQEEEKEMNETGYVTLPIKRFKLWLPDSDCLKIISQGELDLLHELEGL